MIKGKVEKRGGGQQQHIESEEKRGYENDIQFEST